jgi:hypothetical protein
MISRPSTREEQRRGRFGRLWMLWACLIAVTVLVVSLAASNHQRHNAGFDVLDESAHYGYVLALEHGEIPRSGDHESQETLRMLSCVGSYNFTPRGCSEKHRDPADYPAGGYSYEAVQQPPLAYLPYLLTTPTNGAGQSALVEARWGGFVWSVVAAGLLVWIGWLADLSLLEFGAVLAVCLLSPVQIHAMATVTDDSAAVAAGAAALATFLLARRRGKPMVAAGLAVGLIVGFMKGLFLLAPFILLVGVLIADIAARRRPAKADVLQRYGCALAMFVGAAVAYSAWLLIADARAIVPVHTVLQALEGFTKTSYPRPSTMLTGIQNGLSTLSAYAPAPLYWLWNFAVFGSLAGIVLLQGPVARPELRAMALAVFVGVLALAAAFPLLNFVEGHYDTAAQIRYALPILPIVGLVTFRAFRSRSVLIVGVLLPGLAVIAQLVGGQF